MPILGFRARSASGFGLLRRALLRRVQFSRAEARTLDKRALDFLQVLWWLLNAFVCANVRPQPLHSCSNDSIDGPEISADSEV